MRQPLSAEARRVFATIVALVAAERAAQRSAKP